MKNIIYFLILGSLLLSSCTKDEVVSPRSSSPTSAGPINLDNPTECQSSKYLMYQGTCQANLDNQSFSGDTLIVSIVSENDSLFFQEQFSNGSPNFADNPIVKHPVIDNETHLLIPQRFNSNLFYFYGNDTIWKNPNIYVELTFQNCFMTYANGDAFTGDEIGHVDSFDSGLYYLSDKTVVSCVPGFFVDGYLVYGNGQLHASHVLSDGIIPTVSGFYLID